MSIYLTLCVIVIVIVIILFYQRYHVIKDPSINLSDMLTQAKTGDIILMKQDNFLSTAYMNYYTHVGLIVVINSKPYIFEAWMHGFGGGPIIKPNQEKQEIFLIPLKERLEMFDGACYFSALQDQPTPEGYNKLRKFILEALNHYHFNANILRFVGLSDFDNGVVCSELVLMALAELGVVSSHLRYFHNLLNVSNLDNYSQPRYVKLNLKSE